MIMIDVDLGAVLESDGQKITSALRIDPHDFRGRPIGSNNEPALIERFDRDPAVWRQYWSPVAEGLAQLAGGLELLAGPDRQRASRGHQNDFVVERQAGVAERLDRRRNEIAIVAGLVAEIADDETGKSVIAQLRACLGDDIAVDVDEFFMRHRR